MFANYLVRAQLGLIQCEKEGFTIDLSTNCSTYYYCVKSANNEFYPIEYKCPPGEEFSLILLKCIPERENECGNLPETLAEDPIFSDKFMCPSQGRFPDVESIDCKSYYTCSADLIPAENTCPSITIFSWTAMKCVLPDTFTCPNSVVTTTPEPITTHDPDKFVCTSEGRFTDPQTEDCKTYYLCAKTPTGSVAASLNRCPSTTLFSPIARACVLPENYICPLTVTPTSTVESSTTALAESTESTTGSSTEIYITDVSTQESTHGETTEIIELSTSDCATDDVEISTLPVSPTGTVEPPTTVPASESTSESTTEPIIIEISTQDTSAWGTDEIEQSSSTAASTNTVKPTTEPTNEVSSQEPTTGVLTDTTETTIKTEETTVAETISTVEVTYSFSVETTEVESTTVEISTNEITTKDPSVSFSCTGNGRFPNLVSSDCKSYYLCSVDKEGILQATLNQCPTVTVFDSVLLKCVLPTEYTCSQAVSTTTDATEEPITTEGSTQEPPINEAFVCPSIGRYPDPTSADCKRYYLCSGTAAETYEAVLTQCPTTTLFSPETKRCVLSTQYQCPTYTPNTEPAEPSTTEANTDKFVCKTVGRQPDPSQLDCKKYKYCLLTATNEFLEYTFYCPEGTYFNPTDFRCSNSYICSSHKTTTSNIATVAPTMAEPFVCTSSGRFSDPLITGCETYIMCLITATGDVQQYSFKCPNGYRFNQNEAKCVLNYECV